MAGAYDEIVAATTYPMKAWMLFVTSQAQDFASGREFQVDLAVGGAGSEVPLLERMQFVEGSTGDHVAPAVYGPFWYPVPAGVRLSCRMQSAAASDGAFTYNYVIGFD
jgi:hypothetical protein